MLQRLMPSQPTLRPFDVAVALRLLLEPEDRYEPLAEALATSTSAVHRSVARLQVAALLQPGSRTVARPALREFLLHGVRFAFPAVRGPEVVGVATAWAYAPIANRLPPNTLPERERPLVWPQEGGSARGDLLVPLFPAVVRVVQQDTRLHELLAAVDALRAGTPSVQRAVSDYLSERVLWGADAAPTAVRQAP